MVLFITKVQPRAPRPFLLSGLSLYMYTPLLSLALAVE